MEANKYCRLLMVLLCLAVPTSVTSGSPSGFKETKFQGSSPKLSGGELTYTLMPGQCSAKLYGDGRGESDCKNGAIRSRITNTKYARLGQTMEYSVDFWIQPGFRYNKGRPPRSKLTIMEWQRINTIKNHIYMMHLDSTGAKFEDKLCFSSKKFGQWVNFKMNVRWSKKDDGFIDVFCDGKHIYALRGQNAIPPGCGTEAKSQCHLDKIDLGPPIQWQIGPHLSGYGMNHKNYGFDSPFRAWPKSGLTMKTRNHYYSRPRK